jgi:hypothetical protein
MIEYTVAYYRDQSTAERWERAGVYDKPAGWVTSPVRTSKRAEAERTVDAINAQSPEFPAHLVELK